MRRAANFTTVPKTPVRSVGGMRVCAVPVVVTL
jgi:hypothetical protein